MAGLLDMLGGFQDDPRRKLMQLPDPQLMGLLSQGSGMFNPEPMTPQPMEVGSFQPRGQMVQPNTNGWAPNAPMPGTPNPDLPAPGAVEAANTVPMPPVRPQGLGILGGGSQPPMPPERPANLGTPAPATPAPAAQAPQAGQSGLDKLGDVLGGLYGKGGPGDSLIALGAGLASGPNWGAGLMKGMSMVNANALTADKRALERAQAQQKLLGISGGMETLRKTYPGLTDAQYASLAQNPQVMLEASKRLGGADVFRPVTDPAERARLGIDPNDKSPYQIDRDGKLSAVGTPQNNVNVNTASDPVLKGLGDQVIEGRKNAATAVETIRSIHAQRDALGAPGGIFSGFGADAKLNLARAGAMFGITDPAKVANTEVFRAEAGNAVLSSIKALGANPSNTDRDYIEKVKGGNITLNQESMQQLLDLQEKYARESIAKHNELAGKMIKSIPGLSGVAGALSIEDPPQYTPKQQPAPAQGQKPVKPTSWRIVQ